MPKPLSHHPRNGLMNEPGSKYQYPHGNNHSHKRYTHTQQQECTILLEHTHSRKKYSKRWRCICSWYWNQHTSRTKDDRNHNRDSKHRNECRKTSTHKSLKETKKLLNNRIRTTTCIDRNWQFSSPFRYPRTLTS